MEMKFDFSGIDKKSAVNNNVSLKPYGIYNVEFDSMNPNVLKSKDGQKEFHTIELKFHGEEGSFSTNLFIPSTDEDIKRNVQTSSKGHEYETPSRFEEFKWTLLQITQVVNPEGYEKLKVQAPKIKTIEDFIKLVTSISNAKKGTKTKLKLVGRNSDGKIYANLPRVCRINNEGECYVSNNFIGEHVAFTPYEASQAEQFKNAKPTNMPANIGTVDTPKGSEEEIGIDFDSLLS